MLASSRGDIMLGVRIKDEDYFSSEDVIWLNFEELYQLYHQDALAIFRQYLASVSGVLYFLFT
jgi:hypothetical protein